jgi:hypothetical protein
MANEHPINPPPELVQQWLNEVDEGNIFGEHLASRAAQWGADQELEACVASIHTMYGKGRADWMREMRRPKPLSLKEQALMGLSRIESTGEFFSDGMKDLDTIRRAVEALPDD